MINIPNLKYKTTLCLNWKEGTPCQKDPNCYFAHGEHELRKIEDNQEAIASRNLYYQQFQQSTNYKTVYCKFYAKGQCKLGASCTFAHQKKQKRKINKFVYNQQPPAMAYLPYMAPFIYPFYPSLDPTMYYTCNIQSFQNVQNNVEDLSPLLKSAQNGEIQLKSEEKRRSRIEEGSTNQKSRQEIENEEDCVKIQSPNKCFSFNDAQ